MVILPSVIINPDVDNDNSNSGLKAQRRKKQVVDRMGFVNGNKDTRGLCGSKIWEEHCPKCSDINVYSSVNKGDDNLPAVEVLSSIINDPEVDNDNSNSGLKTQRRKKQVIDTMGFVNGNKDTQSLYFSRVWEGPSPECSDTDTEPSDRVETEYSPKDYDINVYSSDNKGDDKLLTMVILPSIIKNPYVDNDN